MNYKAKTSLTAWIARVPLIAGLALLAISGAHAQEKPKKPAPNVPSATPPTLSADAANAQLTQKSSGGPQEGIKVHGHWTIVVKNPDGTVASNNEFENSLARGTGNTLLASLLGHQNGSGDWTVDLALTSGGVVSSLSIGETAGGLVLAINGGTISLTGTTKATATGNVTQVGTILHICPGSVTTAGCTRTPGAGTFQNFTGHTLATPVAVQVGQTIDFTVVLSFS